MDATLITQLKILKMSDYKPNFSELARMYDMDRRTVKKYYDGYSGKPAHHAKPSRLDIHEDLIRNKLSIKGTTMKAVYEFIFSEVDPAIGTYSNFIKYIKRKGISLDKTPRSSKIRNRSRNPGAGRLERGCIDSQSLWRNLHLSGV